jgi:hypothetical protein
VPIALHILRRQNSGKTKWLLDFSSRGSVELILEWEFVLFRRCLRWCRHCSYKHKNLFSGFLRVPSAEALILSAESAL